MATSQSTTSAGIRTWLAGAAAPVGLGVILLVIWQASVTYYAVPHYVLPSPVRIAKALAEDWATLGLSLLSTLRVTFVALFLAVTLGVMLAILLTQWRWLERSLLPYAVVLQVTPIVSLAPLIIIWVGDIQVALLICAWLVAFFPILSNTILGLNSADHNLVDLFEVYGATRWQKLVLLRLPASMPYFLGGLKISGGLALIGAVVAELSLSSNGGLGARLLAGSYYGQTVQIWAALLAAAVLAAVLVWAIGVVQGLTLKRMGFAR